MKMNKRTFLKLSAAVGGSAVLSPARLLSAQTPPSTPSPVRGRRPRMPLPVRADQSIRGRAYVIAHRGSSMERPEHTLSAYRLAMEQGAHYIEPDLRMSKDGVFIPMHDGSLNRTTDVADRPEFADRATQDSRGRTIWRPSDFTMAELRTLRKKQGRETRPSEFDYQETIPSFEDMVKLVREFRKETGVTVGLCPELKERGQGEAFAKFVKEHGLEDDEDGIPLYVQSFALDDLKAVRPHLKSPCTFLFSRQWPDREEWDDLKKYCDSFSPNKALLLADDAKERIAAAHAAGFDIVGWTFADDSYDAERFGSAREELLLALNNGMDAFFSDSPASGVAIRQEFLRSRRPQRPRRESAD